jgi:hypothetical protein
VLNTAIKYILSYKRTTTNKRTSANKVTYLYFILLTCQYCRSGGQQHIVIEGITDNKEWQILSFALLAVSHYYNSILPAAISCQTLLDSK